MQQGHKYLLAEQVNVQYSNFLKEVTERGTISFSNNISETIHFNILNLTTKLRYAHHEKNYP